MRSRPSRNFFLAVLALLVAWLWPTSTAADSSAVPFYYASATPLDRQVATLVVGVNENVGQAITSRGRKQMTLNINPSLLDSASIRSFTYQKGRLGFVGSAAPSPAPPAVGNGLTPTIAAMPSQIAPALSVLDKPGMIFIAPVER